MPRQGHVDVYAEAEGWTGALEWMDDVDPLPKGSSIRR